jgi:tetratricopeptide (TPR) repeat protein
MDTRPHRTVRIVSLCLLVSVAVCARAHAQAASAVDADRAAALRTSAVAAGYSLDYADALARFEAAIAVSPDDPSLHRLAAATLWMQALFEQGAVTVDDYLGRAKSNVKRRRPSPALDAAFRTHAAKALELAERQLRQRPSDADAHFQIGATQGLLASYTATIEGGVLSGFGSARRAYGEHSRTLELDGRRKDAALIVGVYRYAISMLPVHWRIVAGLVGMRGNRERGLQLVEQAAGHAGETRTNARFTLIAIYNRERRFDDALAIIRGLQQDFPRNRLLWLEAASTAMRAGRPALARQTLEHGLSLCASDARPRAFGEVARWRFTYGSALAALRENALAERELAAVLDLDAHEWIRGRTHKELGKLADLAGDRARAIAHYRRAVTIGRSENDDDSADEAARLIRSAHR